MTSANSLKTIEEQLTFRKQQLEDQLRSLKADDPISCEMVIVPSELGTDSWEAEVHAKTVVACHSLDTIYQNVKKSLQKIKSGTYGTCERCGKLIEQERLEVLPTAAHCTLCF